MSREKAQRRKVQRELEDLVADNESKEREITNLKNKLRYEVSFSLCLSPSTPSKLLSHTCTPLGKICVICNFVNFLVKVNLIYLSQLVYDLSPNDCRDSEDELNYTFLLLNQVESKNSRSVSH